MKLNFWQWLGAALLVIGGTVWLIDKYRTPPAPVPAPAPVVATQPAVAVTQPAPSTQSAAATQPAK